MRSELFIVLGVAVGLLVAGIACVRHENARQGASPWATFAAWVSFVGAAVAGLIACLLMMATSER